MRAYHQGSQVVIEVADDGAGIDLERVAAKAVRLGLLTAEDVPSRSSEQLLDLMFTSGFSTREEVSEISGRGVGLDVVRSGVTRLGGQLDVTSDAGRGTTFRVRLPLSLAVLDALEPEVLRDSSLVPSVRGDLLERAGRWAEAAEAFAAAVALTRNAGERVLLQRRAEENLERAAYPD